MKSLTLDLEDDVYRRAAELADRRGVSVDRLVVDYLAGLDADAGSTAAASPSERPLLVFVHMPKAAGTTFRAFLNKSFGRDSVRWIRKTTPFDPAVDSLDGYAAFGGHAHLPRMQKMSAGRNAVYVAIVRDPLSRMLSQFNYVRQRPEHTLYCGDDIRAALTPGTKFYEASQNFQCRYLSGRADFNAVRRIIGKERVLIGAVEALDQLIDRVCEIWDVKPSKLKTLNSGSSSYREQFMVDEALEFKDAHLKEDAKLYEFIRAEGVYENL